MRRNGLAIVLLLMYVPAWGATYYVDATGGNDSNAGTATGSAWKTIAKVNASSFSAGDFILFKRSETWREPLVVPSSGSAGNPITFSAFGTGNLPLLMASSSKSNPGDWTADASANIWFATGFPTDVGSIMVNGTTVLTGKVSAKAGLNSQGKFWHNPSNNSVYMYSTSNPATYYNNGIECWWKGTAASNGNIIHANGKNYLDFQDLELKYGGGNGIQLVDTTGSNIRRLTVSYVGGSYLTGTTRYGNGIELWEGANTVTVENNTVSQTFDECLTSQSSGAVTRANITFQNNTADKCGRGFAFSTNSGSPTINNVYILNNTFTNSGLGWSVPAVSNGQGIGALFNAPETTNGYFRGNTIKNTATGADPIGQGITIYGGEWTMSDNYLENTHNSSVMVFSDTTLNFNYNVVYGAGQLFLIKSNMNIVNIYNNVFFNTSGSPWGTVTLGQDGFNLSNVVFKNNIIYDTANSNWTFRVGANTTAIVGNNLYYDADGTTTCHWSNGNNYTSRGTWEAASGETGSVWSNPLFLSTSTPDFHLQSSSPAINAGTYVSLNSDYVGNAIQGLPDIGAYEYQAILRIPSSPGSLRIN